MLAKQFSRLFWVFSALGALACTGGQTGEEGDARCRAERTPLTLDEVSPLGIAPNDLWALTHGGFSIPLTWLPVTGLEYGPESGASTLTLRLENARAPVYIHSEYRAPATELLYLACADSLELTADAALSSAGGALDESFEATLTAQNATTTLLLKDFDPGKLGGALALQPAAPSLRVPRLSFQVQWTADGASGLLAAGLEQTSSAATSFRLAPLACFGPTSGRNDCPP